MTPEEDMYGSDKQMRGRDEALGGGNRDIRIHHTSYRTEGHFADLVHGKLDRTVYRFT